jgi:hypothetical protein
MVGGTTMNALQLIAMMHSNSNAIGRILVQQIIIWFYCVDG